MLLVEEARVPEENYRSVASLQNYISFSGQQWITAKSMVLKYGK